MHFIIFSVPKETQHVPSKPRASPSSEVPQTKPGRYIVSLSYHTDMCVLPYCDQWSFRFICIPWVYMLEHSLRDKIQYHMSWHVEFTSNLVILKSLIFSSLLDFKSLQQWTFSVQLSVKTGLSCVNLHGFWESNGWKGGVSLQRGKVFSVFLKLCTCFFFPRHNHLFVLFSSLLHSPYVVQGFKNV